ncbi:hypothetical protein PVA45_07795 (plasmid) [Entomospira entomophila]|uniref:Uncharacterized protein n=1 Tax=Entomospira entomophila TaxID=2719988 RepID=A0A968GB39_9SPIO|nr:hypothetical protein [Entomospira entomophilus]NIZ41406.1 hypothetical protein [Entomospira entomophilus]WDI36356.1 hypothetical protein PVA45_07795 [Entomospira entomophilus]
MLSIAHIKRNLHDWLIRRSEGVRNWLLKPLLELMAEQDRRSQQAWAESIYQELVEQVEESTTQRLVSLNALLQKTYHASDCSLGLRYQPPRSSEEAILLLSQLMPVLHGYLHRSDHYPLLSYLTYHYQALWPMIQQSVVTKSGISLEHVAFADLGVQGLLEAIHVFAQGIAQTNIPDQYLSYLGGLDERAILRLFHDIHRDQLQLDPHDPWPHLLGQALQYSAMQAQEDNQQEANSQQLRQDIIQAIEQLLGVEVSRG